VTSLFESVATDHWKLDRSIRRAPTLSPWQLHVATRTRTQGGLA
jgi:hypothetical protein